MKILVTGSSGHLGEALVGTLRSRAPGRRARYRREPFTAEVGSISDRACVRHCMAGVEVVLHAATLHKPHVATHSRQDFVDTNVTGTLNLLEAAVAAGVRVVRLHQHDQRVRRRAGAAAGAPAAWVTEDVAPVPKNIYGVTKAAAEDLCQLFHRNQHLPCIVLRTSRFFPEEDDDRSVRDAYADDNAKANEYLHRRVDVEDVVSAHLLAARQAPSLGFRRYIISATTPFSTDDLADLRRDASSVVHRRVPHYAAEYARRGWSMAPSIDRVYVNARARQRARLAAALRLRVCRSSASPRARISAARLHAWSAQKAIMRKPSPKGLILWSERGAPPMTTSECPMCRAAAADEGLERVEVLAGRALAPDGQPVLGGGWLRLSRTETPHPLHHRAGRAGGRRASDRPWRAAQMRLKEAAGAEVVYVYIFGDGVPHLHLHLAPHRSGDALNDQMIRGEIVEEKLPNGMTRFSSSDFQHCRAVSSYRSPSGCGKGCLRARNEGEEARGKAYHRCSLVASRQPSGRTCCRNSSLLERACHGPAARPAGWLRRHSRTQIDVKARRPRRASRRTGR